MRQLSAIMRKPGRRVDQVGLDAVKKPGLGLPGGFRDLKGGRNGWPRLRSGIVGYHALNAKMSAIPRGLSQRWMNVYAHDRINMQLSLTQAVIV